jgi:hypothetical protein
MGLQNQMVYSLIGTLYRGAPLVVGRTWTPQQVVNYITMVML